MKWTDEYVQLLTDADRAEAFLKRDIENILDELYHEDTYKIALAIAAACERINTDIPDFENFERSLESLRSRLDEIKDYENVSE